MRFFKMMDAVEQDNDIITFFKRVHRRIRHAYGCKSPGQDKSFRSQFFQTIIQRRLIKSRLKFFAENIVAFPGLNKMPFFTREIR